MKSKLRTVFLKQECVTRSVFICLGLVALIGAIVILCDGYKGDYLGPSAIVASYSFIVDIVFAYLAVSSLGREFQNRTINMIRVSSLSGREVILRKLLSVVYSCCYYFGFGVGLLQIFCATCRFSFVGLY